MECRLIANLWSPSSSRTYFCLAFYSPSLCPPRRRRVWPRSPPPPLPPPPPRPRHLRRRRRPQCGPSPRSPPGKEIKSLILGLCTVPPRKKCTHYCIFLRCTYIFETIAFPAQKNIIRAMLFFLAKEYFCWKKVWKMHVSFSTKTTMKRTLLRLNISPSELLWPDAWTWKRWIDRLIWRRQTDSVFPFFFWRARRGKREWGVRKGEGGCYIL